MTNLLIISHSNNHWPTAEKNSSAIMHMVFPFISRFSLHFVLFWPLVRNSVSWCLIFNWRPNFHNTLCLYWSVNVTYVNASIINHYSKCPDWVQSTETVRHRDTSTGSGHHNQGHRWTRSLSTFLCSGFVPLDIGF